MPFPIADYKVKEWSNIHGMMKGNKGPESTSLM